MNNSSASTSGTGTPADVKAPVSPQIPVPAAEAVTVQTPAIPTPAKGNDEVMSTPAAPAKLS